MAASSSVKVNLSHASACANQGDDKCAEVDVERARAAANESSRSFDEARATGILLRAYSRASDRHFIEAQVSLGICDVGGVNQGLNGAFISGAKHDWLLARRKGKAYNAFSSRLPEYANYISREADACGVKPRPKPAPPDELDVLVAQIDNPLMRSLVKNTLANISDIIDQEGDWAEYSAEIDVLNGAPLPLELRQEILARNLLFRAMGCEKRAR